MGKKEYPQLDELKKLPRGKIGILKTVETIAEEENVNSAENFAYSLEDETFGDYNAAFQHASELTAEITESNPTKTSYYVVHEYPNYPGNFGLRYVPRPNQLVRNKNQDDGSEENG